MELEKVTKERQNDEKRRYDDACGLAHALDLLGERWAMLVLRELAYGPRRFSELKSDLQGISANLSGDRMGAGGRAGHRVTRTMGSAKSAARPDAADESRLVADVASDAHFSGACRGGQSARLLPTR